MVRPLAFAVLVGSAIACGQSTPPPEVPAATSTASAGSAAPVASTEVTVPPSTAPSVASAEPPADGPEGTAATASGPPSASPAGGKGKTPSIRQGATSVNGRLPPEIIQRILRGHFGVFRKCYETALQKNAKLEGRVTVKLVIGKDGKVSSAADGGSDIGDGKLIACIVDDVGKATFPQPEGGIVTVVYPVVFQPPAP